MTDAIEQVATFAAPDGVRLFRRSWSRPGARVALAVVHGFGEHSGRYAAFAEPLGRAGIAIHSFDLRGHGRSPGARGHIATWADYRADLDAFLGLVRALQPDRPVVLLGPASGRWWRWNTRSTSGRRWPVWRSAGRRSMAPRAASSR